MVGFISEYANDLECVTQPRIYQKLFWKSASVRGFLMPHFSEYAVEGRDRLLDLFYTDKLKVAVDSTVPIATSWRTRFARSRINPACDIVYQ